MGKRTIMIVAALVIHSLIATASERVREFAEYQCKLTLPAPGFEWLDHSKIPQAMAALGDESGVMLLMLANRAPHGFVLNESFHKGFDKSFNQPGVVSKISGAITTFRGVPCYELHARFEQDGSIATIRAFGANGYLYQLQLIGSNLPIEERGKLESVFSAFEFVGTPSLPAPMSRSSNQTAYNFSENMGRIAGYCILGIIVLAVAGKVFARRKRTLNKTLQRTECRR